MKTEFLKFQLSKVAMNEIRGGSQICHCKTGGGVYQLADASFETLDKEMKEKCGDDIGWACRPLKLEF